VEESGTLSAEARRARNGGNSLCASGTGRDHMSYRRMTSRSISNELISFFQLCRHRYSLLTVFSGVRIGEERWNVAGKAVAGARGVSCGCHFLSRVFLYFFYFCSQRIVTLRHTFAVPKDTRASSLSFFPQSLVYSPVLHRTACGAVVGPCRRRALVRPLGFFRRPGTRNSSDCRIVKKK